MCQIKAAVKNDWGLIFDAVRRLRDGTWNLDMEDLEQAWHLFPQIGMALEDHIRYEQRYVFPGLKEQKRSQHQKEHVALQAIVWSLEAALRRKDSERFQALLFVLMKLLDEHHADAMLGGPEETSSSDETIEFVYRLCQRSHRPTLEYV